MSKYYRHKVQKWLAGDSPRGRYRWRRLRTRFLSFLVGGILVAITLAVVVGFGVIAFYSKDLPSPDRLTTREVPQSTKIYSRDGVLLYEVFGDERRTLITLDDIPEFLKQATISVEDKDFYEHKGLDFTGWIRATRNIIQGKGLQSGSTITQQVVKNTLLSPERNITRKIKEVILSIQLERKYSKDEILQMYFNESPYGGQAWGIGAAAEMYYGKHVRDLTIAEATMIAGLPQSPSWYSPCGAYPENGVVRQEIVLTLMEEEGYITGEEKEAIPGEDLSFVCLGYSQSDIKAPHFVMYVKNVLTEMFGEKMVEQGGLRVTTSLDWNAQQVTEEEARKQIETLQASNANASNAGVVVTDPNTGQILSMVGSIDYFDTENDGNVNVTLSERQPGSSIKPITYLTAFRQGYTPATYVSDISICFPGGAGNPDYCPVNWDSKFWGPMSIRTALSNSRNIPAVKMMQAVGMQNMIDMAHQLGITSLNDTDRYGLSLTLGGGEVRLIDMAQVYSVFANMGVRNDLTPLLRVEDSQGRILHDFRQTSREVVNPSYVYLLNNILSDANARRATFGGSMEIGRTLAAKTGTTNDNRDAWTIGYVPQLVTAVWVGNFNNDPMNGIQGSTGATPIMKAIMKRLLDGQEAKNWDAPSDIIRRSVDRVSGLIPQEGLELPTVEEIFVKGTVPTKVDDFHVSVRVCTEDQNKLATQYHIDNNLAQTRVYTYLQEIRTEWQPYTNEWMNARSGDGYGKPPEEKCEIKIDNEVVEGPVVSITTPQNDSEITTMKFNVEVSIYSVERITQVEFYWDDEEMRTLTSEPYKVEYNLDNLNKSKYKSAGIHTIKINATDASGTETAQSIEVNLKNPNAETDESSSTGESTDDAASKPNRFQDILGENILPNLIQ